jgi:hypothetical protein
VTGVTGARTFVVQTLWAEKIQSTTDAGSLNTFGRNEIEVAPISSAFLRTAYLVILYKTCRVPDQASGDGPQRNQCAAGTARDPNSFSIKIRVGPHGAKP